jgi:hypothetical protein
VSSGIVPSKIPRRDFLTLSSLAALTSAIEPWSTSDDIHPLHLHRHSFELTRIGGMTLA